MFSSSRGSVEPFLNWIILAEISESTFDARDPEKGLNVAVDVQSNNDLLTFQCLGKNGYAQESICFVLPSAILQEIGGQGVI